MTAKAGDQKKMWLVLVAVALFFFSLSSSSVSAADPGHGAGVIGSADFESGNYSFSDGRGAC